MEWVIILFIILLIFGPTKLPQLARGLGKALYEFRRASQGLVEEEEEKKKKPAAAKPSAEAKSSTGTTEISDELLKQLAAKLGITTEGKSREDLLKEVIELAKKQGLLGGEEKAAGTAAGQAAAGSQ
ncbi:MAG: twin-arginine translocase TatA/TatE family subunit [Crenarchaeota archaeon]|nr:twin-arginine translocase TatA/TatE family subunit [Thermoproteota archaeon]